MKTATTGPLIVYGDRNPPGTASTGSVNPDKGPSVFWGGTIIMDPRIGYNVTRYGVMGWTNLGDMIVVDAVPSAIGTGGVNSGPNNVAAAQAPVSGTALTLRSSTGSGITVISTAFTAWPSGNTIAANTLAVEQAFGLVTFGIADAASGLYRVNAYDPTKSITRNLTINGNGDDRGGTYTVAGYDLYGYAQTEAITGANTNAAVSGAKAWKYITSITPAGTINSTSISIGTGDVYGLPLLANSFGYVEIFWNNSAVTASTGFTAGVLTSPATSTTGDPRGSYALQAASNGTLRLTMAMAVNPNNVSTSAGLFGVTPA